MLQKRLLLFRCDSFISLCIRVIHTVTKRLQTYCVKASFCNNDEEWNQHSSKSTRNFWMVAEINICTLWWIILVHKFTKPQCIKAFTSPISSIYNSTLNQISLLSLYRMVWIRNHFSPYISKRHTISIYDVYSLSSLEVRYDTIHKLFDASLNMRWSRHSKFAIHTYMWFNYRVEWNIFHLWFCNIIWCI